MLIGFTSISFTISMPLFQKQKKRVVNFCMQIMYSRFFILLKKRHNNIEKIDVIEKEGGNVIII